MPRLFLLSRNVVPCKRFEFGTNAMLATCNCSNIWYTLKLSWATNTSQSKVHAYKNDILQEWYLKTVFSVFANCLQSNFPQYCGPRNYKEVLWDLSTNYLSCHCSMNVVQICERFTVFVSLSQQEIIQGRNRQKQIGLVIFFVFKCKSLKNITYRL